MSLATAAPPPDDDHAAVPHEHQHDGKPLAPSARRASRASAHDAPQQQQRSGLDTELDEVSRWLSSQGFPQYVEAFRHGRVTATEIPHLEDRHLKELGVAKVGHRIKLLQGMKKFRRALRNFERNDVLLHVREWYWRPRFLVWFPTYYDITPSALILHVQYPLRCAVVDEVVDLSSIVDINLTELVGFLGYVDIEARDTVHPRLRLRLRLHKARYLFSILRNAWEEDQLRVGAGIAQTAVRT